LVKLVIQIDKIIVVRMIHSAPSICYPLSLNIRTVAVLLIPLPGMGINAPAGFLGRLRGILFLTPLERMGPIFLFSLGCSFVRIESRGSTLMGPKALLATPRHPFFSLASVGALALLLA